MFHKLLYRKIKRKYNVCPKKWVENILVAELIEQAAYQVGDLTG